MSTAVGVAAITRHVKRVRFCSSVDLVIPLEPEKAEVRAVRIARSLIRIDVVILDVGCRSLTQFAVALLLNLLGKLGQHTGVPFTTNLSFGESSSVFADSVMTISFICRLTYHRYIIRMRNESDRFLHSSATAKTKFRAVPHARACPSTDLNTVTPTTTTR